MYDTVKGSDWLGEMRMPLNLCAARAPRSGAIQLEHMGIARLTAWKAAKLSASVWRPCTAEHRQTCGRARLRRGRPYRSRHVTTLYQQNVAPNLIFCGVTALDLIRNEEGDVLGVTAMEMETGQVYIFHAKAV